MGQVVWYSTFLILVFSSYCQGFDAIVECEQESAPGVNDTKFDQNNKQTMSQESLDSSYLEVHIEISFNTLKGSFHREKDEKLGQMNGNSTNVDVLPPLAFNDTENRMEDMLAQRQNVTTCTRGMAHDDATRPRLEVMRDTTLNRDILCDTWTDGGGWIVIQRRTKGDVDFYKDWDAYKNGFGTPPGDFWLGNDAIHELTNKDAYELRVELHNGTKDLFAVYSSFKIESEANNYTLRLGSHSGTLGEDTTETGLSAHNGNAFSTFDRDNDESRKNCAESRHGAWWYGNCYWVHLNGDWGQEDWDSMLWMDGQWIHYAKSTQMMIRRL